MNKLIAFILGCFLAIISASPAEAQRNIAGQWLVSLLNQDSTPYREETWTFIKTADFDTTSAYVGSGSSGAETWTSVVSVQVNEFAKVDTINDNQTLTAVFSGIVNEDSTQITGDWVTSLAVQGTFVANRISPIPLDPKTKIEDAPNITIQADDITVTMEKFSKALPKSTRKALAALVQTRATKKVTIQYEVKIKGATKQQTRKTVISKRNQVTVRNLKPGNYTSSYKVQAVQDGKIIYSTRASPKATFVIP